MKALKYKLQSVLLPILLGIVILTLWQLGVIHKVFHIKVLQLPLPFDIAKAFWKNILKIIPHAAVTLVPAICGLALGALIGYATALIATSWPNAGYGSMFLMSIVNAIPIVALAPLMNRWFSSDFLAKIAVITVAGSGSMAVNAFRGLSDFSRSLTDLMYENAASKRDVFIKLRIPASLPSVFTALKIGISASMLATIISEFFSGRTAGLGYMIKYSLKVGNQKQTGWAYIVAVSLLSILLYGIVCLFEKRCLKWHVSQKK